MILECKHQGKDIRKLNGESTACGYCQGIEVSDDDGNWRTIRLFSVMMCPPPRVPDAMFNCPATNLQKLKEWYRDGKVKEKEGE